MRASHLSEDEVLQALYALVTAKILHLHPQRSNAKPILMNVAKTNSSAPSLLGS